MDIQTLIKNVSPSGDGFITMVADGLPRNITSDNIGFDKALAAFEKSDWENLFVLMSPEKAVQEFFLEYEDVKVENGAVYFRDEVLHGSLVERIIRLLETGKDALPFVKFLIRLQNNPSKRAVDELYSFLEHEGLPITSSGCFLAYKAIREDYTDVYSGNFNNEVGKEHSMPRNRVDDNCEVACSEGFHAGTLSYARSFKPSGGYIMLVEIDPADVVSIPKDCECQKARTCRYKVVEIYTDTTPLPNEVYDSRYEESGDVDVCGMDYEYDEDEEEDEEEEEDSCDCVRVALGTENRISIPAKFISEFKRDYLYGRYTLNVDQHEDDVIVSQGDSVNHTHSVSSNNALRIRVKHPCQSRLYTLNCVRFDGCVTLIATPV